MPTILTGFSIDQVFADFQCMTPTAPALLAQTYGYDDASRLETVTEGTTARATYGYTNGKRTSLALDNGVTTAYGYNTANGQLDSLATSSTPAGTFSSFDYTRNGIGMPTHVVYADGSTADYAYDATYRLTSEIRKKDGNTIFSQAHTYDNIGNRIRVISTNVYPNRIDLDTVGLWHLDGDTTDGTGNNDGNTLSDGIFVPGKFGEALEMDPARSPVLAEHDDSMNLASGDFTVEAHIKPDVNTGVIVQKGVAPQAPAVFDGWRFYVGSDGFLRFETGATIVTGTVAVPVDAWTHVAVIRDTTAGKIALYVNGVKDVGSEIAYTDAIADTSYNLEIGAGFDGLLDEVRLSKANRSSELLTTDITFVYNSVNQITEDYVTGRRLTAERNVYTYSANGNQKEVITVVGELPAE